MGYSPTNSMASKSSRLSRRATAAPPSGLDADEETLFQRALGPVRAVTLVAVAGIGGVVEDPPLGQRAVSADVELPGRHAAAGHADGLEFVAAVDLRLAALAKPGHPRRVGLRAGRTGLEFGGTCTARSQGKRHTRHEGEAVAADAGTRGTDENAIDRGNHVTSLALEGPCSSGAAVHHGPLWLAAPTVPRQRFSGAGRPKRGAGRMRVRLGSR